MTSKHKTTRNFITLRKNSFENCVLLEKPLSGPHLTITYKIFLVGRAGSGKSFFLNWLSRNKLVLDYHPTIGVSTCLVSTVADLGLPSKSTVQFFIEFWESGGISKRTSEDLLQDCPSDVDAIIFLFSFSEKETFLVLPELMEHARRSIKDRNPCFLALGTCWNIEDPCSVTLRDVADFEMKWMVPVIKLPFLSPTLSPKWFEAGVWKQKRDLVLVLILEQLYLRDREVGPLPLKTSST